MSRKNLVDGSLAYKERKFEVAEELFRKAAGRDPQGLTEEGKIAQTFLARTLHSRFIGDRANKSLAEEAIKEYKKSLSIYKNDQSSYKAIASLYENLQRPDDWQQWVTERSNAADIKPEYRAEALTSLAAKQNTCANEISDTEATKKTVKKDGKDVFQFTKPANAADFDKLKGCVAEGTKLIEQAVALEPDTVKNAGSFNAKAATDEQLKTTLDAIKPFESARSYRASLVFQASRVAEMEGRDADRDKLKLDGDKAKAEFVALSDVSKSLQTEIDSRNAIKAEEANSNKTNNATKK
jgi:tetratricopeptide (TPR) repeat protein